MIYYEIFFLLLLFLAITFVKISLLMTFTFIPISLKTSNIFENRSQVFERSDSTMAYIMIFIIMRLKIN